MGMKYNPLSGHFDQVEDDHLKLKNIGTNTHAQIDTHIANSSIHQTKYTDAEAVAAADASNKFIERNVENTVTDLTTIKRSNGGVPILKLKLEKNSGNVSGAPMTMYAKNTVAGGTYLNTAFTLRFPEMVAQDYYVIGSIYFRKYPGQYQSFIRFYLSDNTADEIYPLELQYNKINLRTYLYLNTIKSGATQAAAGAANKEVWKTNGHATLPNNVLLIGV